jgi:hypothetical protein
MAREDVLVRERPVLVASEHPRRGDGDEIVKVLERAARDDGFVAQLTEDGAAALECFDLSPQARAALLGGDLRWIEDCVGQLPPRLRTWIDCRLQQEIW